MQGLINIPGRHRCYHHLREEGTGETRESRRNRGEVGRREEEGRKVQGKKRGSLVPLHLEEMGGVAGKGREGGERGEIQREGRRGRRVMREERRVTGKGGGKKGDEMEHIETMTT